MIYSDFMEMLIDEWPEVSIHGFLVISFPKGCLIAMDYYAVFVPDALIVDAQKRVLTALRAHDFSQTKENIKLIMLEEAGELMLERRADLFGRHDTQH